MNCLGIVTRIPIGDGFDLNDEFSIYYNVGNILTDQNVFVSHSKMFLLFEWDAA